MPARSTAAVIATLPNSWAGRADSAPLNEPTGVRAAETMTTSVMTGPLELLRTSPGEPSPAFGAFASTAAASHPWPLAPETLPGQDLRNEEEGPCNTTVPDRCWRRPC